MPELSTFCPSIQRLQCRVCPEGCVSTSIYSVAEASLYLCRNRALLLIWKKRHNESCSFFFGFSPSKIIFKPHKSPHPKLWSVYLRLVFFYLSWGFLSSQIVQTKESSSWDFYSSAQPMALSWISGWWFRRKIPERSEIYHLVMTDIAMERSTIFNR